MMVVNLNVYIKWCLCLLDGYHHDVYFYEIIFIMDYVLVNLYQNFIYEIACKMTCFNKYYKDVFINYKV